MVPLGISNYVVYNQLGLTLSIAFNITILSDVTVDFHLVSYLAMKFM
jgi:hypothetical protein